jgi:hypothetical protein
VLSTINYYYSWNSADYATGATKTLADVDRLIVFNLTAAAVAKSTQTLLYKVQPVKSRS